MVRSEGGSIDIGSLVKGPSGDRAEIDVLLVNEKSIKVYECRGNQPGTKLNLTDVNRWLTEKIPTINDSIRHQERFSSSKVRFELWTTGQFHADAIKALKEAKRKTKKYEIAWLNGSEVRQYADKIKAPGIRKILDAHYFDHPLAKFVRPRKPKKIEMRDRSDDKALAPASVARA